MSEQIVNISDVSMQDTRKAGGKGSGLSRLTLVNNINVPEGYIITTEVFDAYNGSRTFPPEFESDLKDILDAAGEDVFWAVRSSAAAEDSPDASFAGLYDSFLNVRGFDDIKSAVISCFASLYNEEAIAYRSKNMYSQTDIAMAVILQKMAPARISGVMSTADPMTSDRHTVLIEAVEGVGADFTKSPDTWSIRGGKVRRRGKNVAGLERADITNLLQIGKRIESAFGRPQNIEWCFDEGEFYILQSRAITNLFPLPPSKDGFKRCYMSLAHIQVMTAVMLPLGMSFFNATSGFSSVEVGGRPYVDITHDFGKLTGSRAIYKRIANIDPLMDSAMREIAGRREYLGSIPKGKTGVRPARNTVRTFFSGLRVQRRNSDKDIETYLSQQRESLQEIDELLAGLSGEEALNEIEQDQKLFYRKVAYDSLGIGMALASLSVANPINTAGEEVLGTKNVIGPLSQSVDHNLTAEMGLAISAIADQVRKSPGVCAYMENTDAFSIEKLRELEGGAEIADAFDAFLSVYGMRCSAELDISAKRFAEDVSQLLPAILNIVKNKPDRYAVKAFERGKREAFEMTEKLNKSILDKFGKRPAKVMRRQIEVFRKFAGIKGYPKYFWVSRYEVYKRTILAEAQKLVDSGALSEIQDVFYLYFDELREAVRSGEVNAELITKRKRDYELYKTLNPPRVIFSDGEVLRGSYGSVIPKGAIPGLGVSNGVVEGRARVVQHMRDAHIEDGDILVTQFTDPSWAPVFLSISGLVTETGGMMSHGAVIAREYGLPAVLSLANATRLIRDGDLIRMNGSEGYVEILDQPFIEE